MNTIIRTFGCKVNQHDSSLLKQRLKAQGFQIASDEKRKKKRGAGGDGSSFISSEGLPSVFVLNTCAVTAEAGKAARRMAAQIKRENPQSFVAVTGCGAQAETALYEQSSSIDLIAGNSHREILPDLLKRAFSEKERNKEAPAPAQSKTFSKGESLLAAPFQSDKPDGGRGGGSGSLQNPAADAAGEKKPPSAGILKQRVFKSNIFKTKGVFAGALAPEPDRARVFVKIQDGYNSFCSFCIIPFGRGRSQSLSIASIIQKTNDLFEQSRVQEIVLTGVHIGDYRDGEKGLADLLQALLSQTAVPRIRLSSLEPPELSDQLMELFQEDRVCPHIHLSAQSACNLVLRAMRRKYRRREVERALQNIEKQLPGAFVGMDLIAGFPAETQADFEETYQVLKDNPWTRLHVFPYSPRPGAFSAKKESLPRAEILKRAAFFRRLSGARFQEERRKQKGTVKKVLPFKKDPSQGISRDYWTIRCGGGGKLRPAGGAAAETDFRRRGQASNSNHAPSPVNGSGGIEESGLSAAARGAEAAALAASALASSAAGKEISVLVTGQKNGLLFGEPLPPGP